MSTPEGVRERWRMRPEARALSAVSAGLIGLGLLMLYSASAITAVDAALPSTHFVARQAQGVLVGVVAFMACAKIDAERWRALAWPFMLGSIGLMLITVLPFTTAIAPSIGGSRRFLLGGSFQPAEVAKLAVIVWTAMLLVKKGETIRRFSKGLVPFLTMVGVLALLAILQPDISMALTLCLLMGILVFVGGARFGHFVLLAMLALPVFVQQASKNRYVRARIESFFTDGAGDAAATSIVAVAEQQHQSLIAVGSGGLLGVGIGEGYQQRGWVPLAYNDFIASVIGEELGLLGMSALILAFAAYGWLGFRIAKHARSPFQRLVAIGVTYVTVLTAFVHIGVTIGVLPNTGLTLPFISYGRSNLVLTMLMTGVLVNIGSAREKVYGVSASDPLGA